MRRGGATIAVPTPPLFRQSGSSAQFGDYRIFFIICIIFLPPPPCIIFIILLIWSNCFKS
jgi:hypothetical protein